MTFDSLEPIFFPTPARRIGFAAIVATVTAAAIVAATTVPKTAATLPDEPAAPKADRADIGVATDKADTDIVPKPIRTIPISPMEQQPVFAAPSPPAPTSAPPSAPPPKPPAPAARVRTAEAAPAPDICQRHGGRRVEYDNGKRWRCAFPKR